MGTKGFLRLSALFLSLMASSSLNAATVDRIIKQKSVVRVNEGTASGYSVGGKVCFFTTSGKKVACGKIRKVTAKYSYIKVSSKRISRMRKGLVAALEGETPDVSGNMGGVVEDNALSHRTNVFASYIFSALTPAVYNKLTYNAPASSSETVQTLWVDEGSSATSFLTFAFGGEFAVGDSMAALIGLRYRSYRDFIATSDFNGSEFDKYVEISQTATALGLFTDFTYAEFGFLRMSSGLDIDQSSVKLDAVQKQDAGDTNTIASYSSSLITMSLRLGVSSSFFIAGPLGMSVGLNLLMPLTTFSKSASADVTDSQLDSTVDGNQDLIDAVAHDKNSFGAEIVISSFFAF